MRGEQQLLDASTLAMRTRQEPINPAEPPFGIGWLVAERVAVP